MGFNYSMGGESGNKEHTFNVENANKWTDVTIPLSGQTLYASGASPRIIGPLEYGVLYQFVNKKACHVVASSSPTFSATVSYQYIPAESTIYHIGVSGSSEYISVMNHDGSVVEAWASKAEK